MSTEPHPTIKQLASEIGGEIKDNGELCFGPPDRPIYIQAKNGKFLLGSQHPLYDLKKGKMRPVRPLNEGADGDWYWVEVSSQNIRSVLKYALGPSPSVEDEQEFTYESLLRDHCARNISAIETGLKLYEKNGVRGVEFPAGGRFIDILAVDSTGVPVVIEFKRSRGHDQVIGQLLYYMGWIHQNPPHGLVLGQRVRGVIVAREITDALRVAAAASQTDIKLVEYTISVTFKEA